MTYALALLTMVVTLTAFTEAGNRVPSSDEQLSVLASSACTAGCDETCLISTEHKSQTGGTTHGRGFHGCESLGTTCEYHNCKVTAVQPEVDVRSLVADGDIDALRRVLTPSNLIYVPERGVLQVVADCGTVLSQLPVGASVAAVLLE